MSQPQAQSQPESQDPTRIQSLPGQLPSNTRLIQFKIAYWGPGESGKTTNYMWIKRKLGKFKASQGFSIQTTQKRTLWADAVWLRTEMDLAGQHFLIMWQVVTATGQERFLSTREFVLAGADGAVFVADATPNREEDNLRSFRELVALTRVNPIPIIVQQNKTDVPNAIALLDMAKVLGIPASEVRPAVAIKGEGVLESFNAISVEVLKAFFKRINR